MTPRSGYQISLDEAHADGRHASRDRHDRAFWVLAGCAECNRQFDVLGLPRLTP